MNENVVVDREFDSRLAFKNSYSNPMKKKPRKKERKKNRRTKPNIFRSTNTYTLAVGRFHSNRTF